MVLIEKLFYYGATIWALRRAGTSLLKATLVTAGMLACIEAAQVRLRARTPEVSDVVLAVIAGITAVVFRQSRQGSKASATKFVLPVIKRSQS